MDKIVCRKVRVNSQGYAYGGRQYFGTGKPLYYVEFPDGRTGHVRGYTRDCAIIEAINRPEFWGIR